MLIGEHDPLVEKYFQEIEDSVGLSSEQESALCQRIQAGEGAAVGELVSQNLRFVIMVAKQYKGMGLPFADLIAEGNVGMITAAQRFDSARGFRFISYAVWWVRHAILKALAEQGRLVRLPHNRLGALMRLRRMRRHLAQQQGQTPDREEIAAAQEMSVAEVEELAAISEPVFSLDFFCTEDGTERRPGDWIADPTQPPIDAALLAREMKAEIHSVLRSLSEMEAQVLSMYFGLDEWEPMTLEEIGAYFGRTRERMRQIKRRALDKLRQSPRSRSLREYLQADCA